MTLLGNQISSLGQQIAKKGVGLITGRGTNESGQTRIQEVLARRMSQRPQMEYMFAVELPDITIPVAESDIKSDNTFDMVDLNSRIFSATTPFKEYEIDKNRAGDEKVYTIGSSNMPSMNLTLDEMEDGATTRYILDWQKLCKNSDGTRNMPFEYKRNIRILRCGRTTVDTVIMEYVGAWPSQIESIVNTVEGEAVTQLKVNFAVDNVIVSEFTPKELNAAISDLDVDIEKQLLNIEDPLDIFGDVARKILGSKEINKLFGGF